MALKLPFKNPFGKSDDVQYQPVQIDAGTEGLMQDQAKDALRSTDSFTEEAMRGVGDNAPNLQQSAQDFGYQLGMSEPGTGSALANKYSNMMSGDLSRLRRAQEFQSEGRKANRLQSAASSQLAKRQVQIQNYQRQMQAYMANKQARAATLRSVLGLGGMAAGMAIAGPAGGMIGAQAASMGGPQAQNSNPNLYAGQDSSMIG